MERHDPEREVLPSSREHLPSLSGYCGGTLIKPFSITPDLWKNVPAGVVQVIKKRFIPGYS